ncbi:MAG TPA: hypothetical protein VF388_10675 [Lacunisphaera sp.]
MKNDSDPELRELLHAWEASPPPAPRFKSVVWQRIAIQERQSATGPWALLRKWFFVQLPRPAYASALLLLTAVLGLTAASARANHMREQYRLASARQYLASIDPLAMTARMSK